MDVDTLDALTMIPGIMGGHYLASLSDDFVYRIAVLSWGWICICSMIYHLSKCDPKLLRRDMRVQWVSQAVIILETPRVSWPVVLGGLLPVSPTTRMALNGIGGIYASWHSTSSTVLLVISYLAYIAQFPTKKKWLHSVFHVFLQLSAGALALSPVKKYSLPIHPDWAWVVFWTGAFILSPRKEIIDYMKKLELPEEDLWNVLYYCY